MFPLRVVNSNSLRKWYDTKCYAEGTVKKRVLELPPKWQGCGSSANKMADGTNL